MVVNNLFLLQIVLLTNVPTGRPVDTAKERLNNTLNTKIFNVVR